MAGLSAVSASSEMVPFWLQILAIVVAPILGFAGLAIGALLNEGNRRRAYVTDARREAYQAFSDALSEITVYYGAEHRAIMRNPTSTTLSTAYERVCIMTERIQRAYFRMRLIGSSEVVQQAAAAYEYAARASSLTASVLDSGEFDLEAWDPLIMKGFQIQNSFTSAARRDMGIARNQIPLPEPRRAPTAPSEIERRIRSKLNRNLDRPDKADK
jgi:hypothetical protein